MWTSLVSTLIGATLAKNPSIDVLLLQRFLAGFIGLVALTIISAFMGCMVLGCCFYAIYYCLVAAGITTTAAATIVFVGMVLLTILTISLTGARLNQLRGLSLRNLIHLGGARDTPVGGVIGAFLEGFSSHRPVSRG